MGERALNMIVNLNPNVKEWIFFFFKDKDCQAGEKQTKQKYDVSFARDVSI